MINWYWIDTYCYWFIVRFTTTHQLISAKVPSNDILPWKGGQEEPADMLWQGNLHRACRSNGGSAATPTKKPPQHCHSAGHCTLQSIHSTQQVSRGHPASSGKLVWRGRTSGMFWTCCYSLSWPTQPSPWTNNNSMLSAHGAKRVATTPETDRSNVVVVESLPVSSLDSL